MRFAPNLSPLPPYLREVCSLLADGVVRLRRHTAEDVVRGTDVARGQDESSLHFVNPQSGHTKPRDKEIA